MDSWWPCAGAGTGVPFTICYDCDGAASVAQAQTAKCADSALRRAAVAVAAYTHAQGREPVFQHTKAHAGNPGNELADHLAKCVVRSAHARAAVSDEHFNDYVLEGALDWLWFFPAVERGHDLPPLKDGCDTVPQCALETTNVMRRPESCMGHSKCQAGGQACQRSV